MHNSRFISSPSFPFFLSSVSAHISTPYNQTLFYLSSASLPQFHSFFSILPSLHSKLSGGYIIEASLSVASAPSPAPPPSISPSSSLAQCVPGLMQLGRYLGQHQSFIQTPHTHTQNCAYTHTAAFPKCLCMGRTGGEGGDGNKENKNNFSSPPPSFLPL